MTNCSCIFCKIASGEIPSNTIYEDERCRVILDASPAAKGHALILPKEHYEDIFSIEEETLMHVSKTARRVALRMKEALNCDGVNLVQNNGRVAGQTVFHFHMHVIPRYEKDENQGVIEWKPKKFADEEMKEVCDLLKM